MSIVRILARINYRGEEIPDDVRDDNTLHKQLDAYVDGRPLIVCSVGQINGLRLLQN